MVQISVQKAKLLEAIQMNARYWREKKVDDTLSYCKYHLKHPKLMVKSMASKKWSHHNSINNIKHFKSSRSNHHFLRLLKQYH